ncbi:MAG: hypothetical protein AAF492_31260, partial [Verrucomicrobiota bacterium]
MKSKKFLTLSGLVLLQLFVAGAPGQNTVHSDIARVGVKNGWAVNYPKQRKLFFMAGRLWVFYSDGASMVYQTSPDGLAWSDPVTLRRKVTLGHRFGACFDGTYFHVVRCGAEAGEDVIYGRGRPTTEGGIDWRPEVIAYAVPEKKNVMYPKVMVDSAGLPWIAFMVFEGGFNQAPFDAVVTRAVGLDRGWQTAPGFPQVLVNDNTTSYPDPLGVSLTEGKTFWIYNRNVLNDVMYGRLWNGHAWEEEEPVTLKPSAYALYNAVAEGDTVHMVYGGGSIYYRGRDPERGWGTETHLSNDAGGHTSITRTGRNRVLVTWLDVSKQAVRYRELSDGRWL